jgi:uroporphyrinogen-III synthase
MPAQPLAGKRVLVTRAAHQAGKLSELLRALGAEPVEVPVLEIRPPDSYNPLDAAIGNLSSYDWLIFTSTNTVHAFAERARMQGIALTATKQPRVAAIGSATAGAAEEIGLTVSLTPKAYVAESLAAALSPQIADKRILLARAAAARDVIPDTLRAAGAHLDVVDAYRNVLPESAPQLLRAALATHLHAATFTSSSSVTHLAKAAQKAGIAFPLANVPAISIGPVTSQTLRESGWPPAAEASQSDISGLVAAVAQFLRG